MPRRGGRSRSRSRRSHGSRGRRSRAGGRRRRRGRIGRGRFGRARFGRKGRRTRASAFGRRKRFGYGRRHGGFRLGHKKRLFSGRGTRIARFRKPKPNSIFRQGQVIQIPIPIPPSDQYHVIFPYNQALGGFDFNSYNSSETQNRVSRPEVENFITNTHQKVAQMSELMEQKITSPWWLALCFIGALFFIAWIIHNPLTTVDNHGETDSAPWYVFLIAFVLSLLIILITASGVVSQLQEDKGQILEDRLDELLQAENTKLKAANRGCSYMLGEGCYWLTLSKDYCKPANKQCAIYGLPISGITGKYIDPYTGMDMTDEEHNQWKAWAAEPIQTIPKFELKIAYPILFNEQGEIETKSDENQPPPELVQPMSKEQIQQQRQEMIKNQKVHAIGSLNQVSPAQPQGLQNFAGTPAPTAIQFNNHQQITPMFQQNKPSQPGVFTPANNTNMMAMNMAKNQNYSVIPM